MNSDPETFTLRSVFQVLFDVSCENYGNGHSQKTAVFLSKIRKIHGFVIWVYDYIQKKSLYMDPWFVNRPGAQREPVIFPFDFSKNVQPSQDWLEDGLKASSKHY